MSDSVDRKNTHGLSREFSNQIVIADFGDYQVGIFYTYHKWKETSKIKRNVNTSRTI